MQLVEGGIGIGPLGGVFGIEAGGEAAGAIFAGAATFTGFGAAFWCW